MRCLQLTALLTALALVLVPTALAKGPDGATISGPGLGTPVRVSGDEGGTTTALGSLATYGGFYQQAYSSMGFDQQQGRLLSARPKGDLGPRYTVRYSVPGGEGQRWTLTQDLYPYASPAVSYMRPGQIFFGSMRTHGGWFAGSEGLKEVLIAVGLPASAPGGGSGWSGTTIAAVSLVASGAALLLLVGPWRRARRRAAAASQ